MEDLTGGAFNSEHRFTITANLGAYGTVRMYEGIQEPFSIPVLLETFDFGEGITAEECADALLANVRPWAELNHNRLARLVDASYLDPSHPLVISTRRHQVTLGSLLGTMAPFSLEETRHVFSELNEGLSYAHGQGVAHGNLASDFVSLDSETLGELAIGHWCLGFSASQLNSLNHLTPYETRAYSPDRLSDGIEVGASISQRISWDVYSVAVILYELLTGSHPFLDYEDLSIYEHSTYEELIAGRDRDQMDPLEQAGIEEEIAEVIRRGLAPTQAMRWASIQAFYDAFVKACSDEQPLSVQHVIGAGVSATPPAPTPSPVVKVNPVAAATVDPELHPHLEDPTPEGPADPHHDWSAYPSPKGRAFAVALVLLGATNLGWYLWVSLDWPLLGLASGNYSTAQLVRLETEPSGAELTEILPSGEPHLIGSTPLELNLKEFRRGQMDASVSKPGFKTSGLLIGAQGADSTRIRITMTKE